MALHIYLDPWSNKYMCVPFVYIICMCVLCMYVYWWKDCIRCIAKAISGVQGVVYTFPAAQGYNI